MKRLLSRMLAATLALSLAACGQAPADESQAAPQTPETAPAQSAALSEPTSFYTTGSTFNTGTCFYELLPQQLGYYLVAKTDYATATRRILCSVPGCTHDSESCPAWFPGTGLEGSLFAAGEDVYLYHRAPTDLYTGSWEAYRAEQGASVPEEQKAGLTEEDLTTYYRNGYAEASTPACLYRIAADGSGRERIDFSRQLPNLALSWCDGTALYGSITEHSGNTTGYRVSLTNGEVTTFAMMPYEWIVGAQGDRLLTSRTVTDVPLPDPDTEGWDVYTAVLQSSTVEFAWLDPTDGARETVLERPHDGSVDGAADFRGVADGKLYFMRSGQDPEGDGLLAFDPAAGQWLEVCVPLPHAALDLRSVPAACAPDSAERQSRYLRLEGSDVWQGINLCWILDGKSGATFQIQQPLEGNPHQSVVEVRALTDDGRFLLHTAQKDSGVEPLSAYGLVDLRVTYDSGLIPVDAFLQGSADYTPVTVE